MVSSGGWQTTVNVVPAPAVEGDFASKNPRFVVDAGPGGLVSGHLGVTVGRAVWWSDQFQDADNAPAVVNNYGNGPITGIIGREQQGLNTVFLADSGMTIPKGFPVTAYNGGDFWVKNNATSGFVLTGNKAYASFADGSFTFAATGTPTTASINGNISASTTFTFTGAITGSTLTVTSIAGGTLLVPGMLLTGGSITTGTLLSEQISGSVGLVGTYGLSIGEQTQLGAATITAAYSVLTVGTLTSGTIVGNMTLTGGTVIAGTYIIGFGLDGTGTGGTGTYFLSPVNASGTGVALTLASNVETKWIAMSEGGAGELIKISDHALG